MVKYPIVGLLGLLLMGTSTFAMEKNSKSMVPTKKKFHSKKKRTALVSTLQIIKPYTIPDSLKPSKANTIEIVDALLIDPLMAYQCGQYRRKRTEPKLRNLFWDELETHTHDTNNATQSTTTTTTITPTANNTSQEPLFGHQYQKKVKKIIRKSERIYPLFLLEECDEGQECFFRRDLNPEHRNLFETVVSYAVLEKLKKQNGRVTCTSFASGRYFQDLCILTRVLAQWPTAHITFNAIDIDYCYQQPTQDTIDYEFKRGNYGFDRESFMRKQLNTFLRKTFPQAIVNITAYDCVQTYDNDVTQEKEEPADCVYAIDISNNPENRSLDCYRWLCARTLQKKPDSTNKLFNVGNLEDRLVCISHSITLNPPQKLKEYRINFPSNAVIVYETITLIEDLG